MKKISPKSQFSWEHIKESCETLTDDEDALTREMVACIADEWSLWTMSIIVEFGGPMRFSRIMENVAGISQKSLTKTFRGLERDGLITREVFAEVPPRVEYAITPLGTEMLDNVAPLWLWVAKNVHRFQGARAAFNGRSIRVFSLPRKSNSQYRSMLDECIGDYAQIDSEIGQSPIMQ